MEDYPALTSGSPLLRGVIIAAIVVMIGVAVIYSKHVSRLSRTPGDTALAAATPTSNVIATDVSANPTTSSIAATYKDGTYSATGIYESPGGKEALGVQLTVAHDIVTAATVTPGQDGGESRQYQERFASAYKQYVIGKRIDGLSLSHVSGSSLTSGGFNDAVGKIKSQAKA